MIALAALLTLGGCKSSSKPSRIDPEAMIYIHVVERGETKAEGEIDPDDQQPLLTPDQVVRSCSSFCLDIPEEGIKDEQIVITDVMRNAKWTLIQLGGSHIMTPDGELVAHFLKARNVRILGDKGQIIAYIPNETMSTAQSRILRAYNAGNYNELYILFREIYSARPITTNQYQELQDSGKL